MSTYQRLAAVLEKMIESRSLRPGDRVPSVRQFSRQQRVSVPTALHAYVTLETRGFIEARPRSGFFVRARLADAVRPPAGRTRVRSEGGAARLDPRDPMFAEHSGVDLVPFGSALPSEALLPTLKLARILGSLARRSGAKGIAYDPEPGCEPLRRELARRSLEWGSGMTADSFLVTTGATEALSLALQVTCKPGDTVMVEMPTYFGLADLLRALGLKALPIRTDSISGIDLDEVERALRRTRVAACAVIPNFHNPVGSLMPDEAKREFVRLMNSHGVPIIEDDIYGDLQHSGPRPRCLKAFDKDGSVLLCGSFSKTLAPGYRVGYLSGGRWHDRATELKRVTSLASATLPALAVAEFLKNGGYDRYLRGVRVAYRDQVARMREAVVRSFPEGLGLSRPQGGFILWCELPPSVDSMDLFAKARRVGISIKPGTLFAPNGGLNNFIRLNCGQPWTPRLERAVETLGKLVRQDAGRGRD